MKSPTIRFDHINVVVHDLPAAVAFFSHFGFDVKDEADLAGDWISQVVGLSDVRARYAQLESPHSSVLIELIHYENPPSPHSSGLEQANDIGYRHVAFEVGNIEAEVTRLTALGVQFLSPVHTYPRTGKKIIYGRGPEGILIELAQYPALDA